MPGPAVRMSSWRSALRAQCDESATLVDETRRSGWRIRRLDRREMIKDGEQAGRKGPMRLTVSSAADGRGRQ